MDPESRCASSLGRQSRKGLKLEVSGAGDDYRSHGTGGIIRPREGDLGFPRSHNLRVQQGQLSQTSHFPKS